MTGAAALPGAAETLLVRYHSSTLAGQDTAVSGTISIPPGQPPAGGWPVLSWTHGTTGAADICAPSRDAPSHPSHIYNQLADATLSQWVKRGYVGLKTDYEGLVAPGPHRDRQRHLEVPACVDHDLLDGVHGLPPVSAQPSIAPAIN